jgi:hypothetical protein
MVETPGLTGDIYVQAVIKAVAGFFRGNSTQRPQGRSPAK